MVSMQSLYWTLVLGYSHSIYFFANRISSSVTFKRRLAGFGAVLVFTGVKASR